MRGVKVDHPSLPVNIRLRCKILKVKKPLAYCNENLMLCVIVNHFHPGLIFVGKEELIPSLPTNIRLKCLTVTKSLAYYDSKLIKTIQFLMFFVTVKHFKPRLIVLVDSCSGTVLTTLFS